MISAVKAICEAKAVVEKVKAGASVVLASEKAFDLKMLAMELEGNDKAAVNEAAYRVACIVDHPDFVSQDKMIEQALGVLNHFIEQAGGGDPTTEELQKASDDADVDDAYAY